MFWDWAKIMVFNSLSIFRSSYPRISSQLLQLRACPALTFTKTKNQLSCYSTSFNDSTKDNSEKLKANINSKEKFKSPEELEHFKLVKKIKSGSDDVDIFEKLPEPTAYSLPHPIWSENELNSVQITHKIPKGFLEKAAYFCVRVMRTSFDVISGYKWKRTEKIWITRICFLETVAGVPGMVAAMARHLHSLRRMKRDHGWIHTLLEEAENERMHLITALQLKQPSMFFRMSVILVQGIFTNLFFLTYLVVPRFCHVFVGYLEEEAVKTYTKCLEDIESGCLKHWKVLAAPDIASKYWNLGDDASMRDVILAIRADEAHHRHVNHTLGSMNTDAHNPYKPGK